ncbi:MAG: BA14K family protein [Anderseniella sp.]
METGKVELEETELTIKKNTSALLAGLAGLMMMSTPLLASPIGAQYGLGATTFSGGALVVPVAKKKKRRRLRRFRNRRRGFNHFHNGFYYAQPFWNFGDFYEDDYDFYDDDDYDEPDYAGGGDRHEAWCRRKYRSYKVRTDTWTDFNGNTRQCNSPFN